MASNLDRALNIYANALEHARHVGNEKEIAWHRQANIETFTESDLLREAAWVVLCSGFRESIVRRIFDYVSLCFCDWESAKEIAQAYPFCQIAASHVFQNVRKLTAIVEIARRIESVGFANMRSAITIDPIGELGGLPFIGPITVWHLAKNLGLDVAKPDRHLVRISKFLGFTSAADLCHAVAKETGESIKVVDLVFWRYLADVGHARIQEKLTTTSIIPLASPLLVREA